MGGIISAVTPFVPVISAVTSLAGTLAGKGGGVKVSAPPPPPEPPKVPAMDDPEVQATAKRLKRARQSFRDVFTSGRGVLQ